MLKRVSITGPECTGKSWLAEKLAIHFNAKHVPEYSVEYLREKGAEYSIEDILNIAKGQLAEEEKMANTASDLLFSDTDLIVNKIWSQEVFGEVPDWIDKMASIHKYDLYLLCFPDLEWEPGPFRENPKNRQYLFNLYENELKNQGFRYAIVKGTGNQRFQNAINFVDNLLRIS